jgi:hypothetical protein
MVKGRVCVLLKPGVTLLYTNSYDGTADLVVRKLGSENVFRFNFDLWADYNLYIGHGDFEIRSPSGRVLRPEGATKVYWRKPAPTREIFPERRYTTEQVYAEEELWYAMRDLVNLLWEKGKVVLVEPFAEHRIGKLVQMQVARDLFKVPEWKFLRASPGHLKAGRQSVAKSLTLKRIADRAVMYATKVQESELDPNEPWLLQDYVEAEADITVVFVRGRLFAFALDRSFTDISIDWRAVSLDPAFSHWMPHDLPEPISSAIREYMSRLSLDYGRIDLLRQRSGEYVFLEVNPHGEWGWLDPRGEQDILQTVIGEISPETPVHPIPVSPSFTMS